MSSPTKIKIINSAFTELRISGLTVNPTPSNTVNALNRLEEMMREYFTAWNLDVAYNFEDVPDVNSQTNVDLAFKPMMDRCLALRLVPMFNAQVPVELNRLANAAFSGAQGTVAANNIREINPSRRMPKGSGNDLRNIYQRRFMQPTPQAPQESATNRIDEGETQDYQENFSQWLGANAIASFTITVDPRLTLDSSSNNDPLIDYRITAGTDQSFGPWQFVQITVTDSIGRVEIRMVSFDIRALPTVPAP